MDFDKAQDIFNEILELCNESQVPRLLEIASTLYQELDYCTETEDFKRHAEELQVVINEIDFDEEEEEYLESIEQLIEKLQE